jgi:hypothetical protein
LSEPVVDDKTEKNAKQKTIDAASLQESCSLETRESTEEMEVASTSTSSVSMASQASEEDTMQLSETTGT